MANMTPQLTGGDDVSDLQTVSEPGLGFSASIAGSSFAPIAASIRMFYGTGSIAIRTPPSLQRLVSMGVSAIRVLLERLDDQLATHCQLDLGPQPVVATHLDLGEADIEQRGGHFPHRDNWNGDLQYRISVGDLCYVALGQIVNRTYCAVYYRPSLSVVVNSPVSVPTVLGSCRNLWADCNRERHIASLQHDLDFGAVPGWRSGAAVRLLYYYGQLGEASVVEELRRPVYSTFSTFALWEQIESHSESSHHFAAVANLLSQTDAITIAGMADSFSLEISRRPSLGKVRNELLQYLTKRTDGGVVRPISSALQTEFINQLSPFPSRPIDDAVFALLVDLYQRQVDRSDQLDIVILACIRRLLFQPAFVSDVKRMCTALAQCPSIYQTEYAALCNTEV